MAAPSVIIIFLLECFIFCAITVLPITLAQLSPNYYEQICPRAIPTIREIVEKAIDREPRMGASLLRLHFHDCFVNGCDGSNLLDDTATFTGEKTAGPNLNSLRGFDVVDEIKSTLNTICQRNLVSCADILAVAARDSVSILGGPWYEVALGRRDSITASFSDANSNIPSPFSNISTLLSGFKDHGLGIRDVVVLSGAHTIGLARCTVFRSRIFNETNINPQFTASLKQNCPLIGGDNNTSPLDGTTNEFDTAYFQGLLQKKGLLHSDQELFSGDNSESRDLVRLYSYNSFWFWEDFAKSMIKMGNIKPLTGTYGQIRMNCRRAN